MIGILLDDQRTGPREAILVPRPTEKDGLLPGKPLNNKTLNIENCLSLTIRLGMASFWTNRLAVPPDFVYRIFVIRTAVRRNCLLRRKLSGGGGECVGGLGNCKVKLMNFS